VGGSTYALLSLFEDGGIMMYPLVLCSLLALGVIIAKGWTLWVAHKDTQTVLEGCGELARAGRIDEAAELAANTPGPAAAILHAGLRRIREMRVRRGEVEQVISTTGTIELGFLERGLVVLATIANVAPLMGFLGTVAGMILAFASIEGSGQVDPGLVAGGIKVALLTTATGLIIAIPVNIAYNWFVTRIDKLIVDMEQGAQEVFNLAWDLEKQGKLTVVDDRGTDADAPASPRGRPGTIETPLAPSGGVATAPDSVAAAAMGGVASAVADVAEAVNEGLGEGNRSFADITNIPVEEIEGIGPGYGRRLREIGASTTSELLTKCSSAAGRAEVVEYVGVEDLAVRRWTSAADFFRIPGMTGDAAEILEASGIRTIQGLAGQSASELADRLASVNEEQRLVVREALPSQAAVASWIQIATGLPPAVKDL